MNTYVRTFAEIGATDVNLVGGKGANLGEMTRARLPVPPGFCVVAEAYREFLRASGAGETIRHLLAGLVVDDPEDVEVRTDQIRNYLTAQTTPPEIAAEILKSYRALGAELGLPAGAPLRAAVRSSATAEDLPTASFAGQQDSYLNVVGEDAVLEHVKRCWASLWTARAVLYRVKQGFEHEQVALAVVVQSMIPSDVSGILFTANPVTQRRDQIVINASWGLGEAIVSGQVTPDTYIVDKNAHAILEREISSKDLAIEYAAGGGTVEKQVEDARRNKPALPDNQIVELAALGQAIEDHYQAPMDVEWARANEKFYVLQARAITTLPPAAGDRSGAPAPLAPDGEYNRSMLIEIFPEPLSPAFLTVISVVFKSMLDFTFRTLGFRPPDHISAIGVFYAQPYFNRRYVEAALKPLSPASRETLVSQIVNPFGRLEHEVRLELSRHYLGMVLRLLTFMRRFPKQLPGLLADYRKEIAAIGALDLTRMSDREVIERVTSFVYGPASRLLNYDFLMIVLIGLTYRLLGAVLERYFGEESDDIKGQLVSGITGNLTVETNKRIWDLSQMARRSPAVAAALVQYSGETLQSHLAETKEGREFAYALAEFLHEYGHREIRMDILYPTWGEDPGPVIGFLRSYLDLDPSQSPGQRLERLVNQRRAMSEKVKQRLTRDLPERLLAWPLFQRVLDDTQTHIRERDTMHFELTRLFPPFRRYLLELGRRWTERGLIAGPEDIFFLTLEEMSVLSTNPAKMQDRVQARRAEFEANRRRTPPPTIRDGEEIFGETAVVEAGTGLLRGVAGSPGRASGVARVIHGPEEFTRLKSGEILVAPLTTPIWTPLFAIAGGLVTEVGGILSHGAIVAREYGIPAVMAVGGVTRTVQEGQQLTVDGNKGLVHLAPAGRSSPVDSA